jgi:uncharacterized cupin superfamily protein
MNPNNQKPGEILDQAVQEIRNAPLDPNQLEQASANVRHRLQEELYKVLPYPAVSQGDRIESCGDFRALIPAYLTSSLTPSRKLLFEDHIRECVGCRKALETARRGSSHAATPRLFSPSRTRNIKWAVPVAAAALIALALQTVTVRDWLWPIDVHAVVQMVDGGLFTFSGQSIRPVKAGERVERDQAIRTGLNSGAMLELADGTRIEMAPRSEFSLTRARDGVKVRLARGNVIVAAAKQHGHLYVQTSDCTVGVVGTMFSVSAGVKGSRVAVIEGEVEVTQEDGTEQSLLPGDQTYTNPTMGPLPIDEQIAWSRNAEALLKELQTFGQDFALRAEKASMRYTSTLIPLVPADTLVLASLPNASESFKESYALFRQRVAENATLSDWWRQSESPAPALNVDELVNRLSEVGAYIGSEVILAFPKDVDGQLPLLLAEATRPEALVSALEGDLRRIEEADGPGLRLAHDAAELAAMSGPGLVIYVNDGLMIVSSAAKVQRTVAIRKGTITNTFSSTPLYARLAEAYSEGVGWLLAMDLQQTLSPDGTDARQLGLDNVQQLLLEQKTGVGTASSQVSLNFSEQRRGLLAWLGSPAPMGALEFVSQDAYGFYSWITKNPTSILDDILALNGGAFGEQLRSLQETYKIDLRHDLVEPLGNEALLALDGPLLPKPSWKAVIEVHDSARLENTIQWIVTNVNRELEARQLPTWNLASETVDGRTYQSLTSTGAPMEVHFTSWMGYMIFSSSRALLIDAIRIHDSGTSIRHSAKFRAELPADGRDIASAIMYQNLEALSQSLPSMATDVSQDVRESLRAATLMQQSLPKVVFVYGEPNRIFGSAKGSYGLRIASMFGMQHLMGISGVTLHQ